MGDLIFITPMDAPTPLKEVGDIKEKLRICDFFTAVGAYVVLSLISRLLNLRKENIS